MEITTIQPEVKPDVNIRLTAEEAQALWDQFAKIAGDHHATLFIEGTLLDFWITLNPFVDTSKPPANLRYLDDEPPF
jgi:hypothetical protein